MRIIAMLIAMLAVTSASVELENSNQSQSSATWTESQVADLMGLIPSSSGLSWTFETPEGIYCDVAVIMTSESQVQMYKNAGDTVATNPSGTVGVKLTGSDREACIDAATESLKPVD